MRARHDSRLRLVAIALAAAVCVRAQAARTHVVQRGETLSTIASGYGVAVRELARANKLQDADFVRRGQKLQIPDKPAQFAEHLVARGESLGTIAHRYKVSVADIRAYNELRDPDHIEPGQTLRIPRATAVIATPSGPASPPLALLPAPTTPLPAGGAPTRSPAPSRGDPRRQLPAAVLGAIDAAAVTPGRWQHIVVHHSGTDEGSGAGMDRYHREERGMENGLAYHFVIGNGRGMDDGAIFIGNRWKQQLDGGHLAIPALNQNSLGICLVGDFERRPPSRRQLDSLEALVRALERRTGLDVGTVTTHCLIHPRHTECPGKYFPTKTLIKRLKEP